jgi:hypothetical protein
MVDKHGYGSKKKRFILNFKFSPYFKRFSWTEKKNSSYSKDLFGPGSGFILL